MRIIAGSARGRTLATPGPKAQGIRPTSDKVRGAIFNILGQWLDGLSVLDLYAGTGALAFEALSRGAQDAVLVDRGRDALELCRENARALKMEDRVTILPMPADRACEKLGKEARVFEVIFADPPYGDEATASVLGWVTQWKLLGPRGVLVLEHRDDEQSPAAFGEGFRLTRHDQRSFGETAVSFYSVS